MTLGNQSKNEIFFCFPQGEWKKAAKTAKFPIMITNTELVKKVLDLIKNI